ncbi:MAG: hypothetical protein H0V94_00280 [Actinobacteria bacterium]|nr:hypothetical protein [Actinomycetota bacterium]
MLVVTFAAISLGSGEAHAHLDIRPGLLESGREQTLQIELPELRSGGRPVALAVSGAGVRTIASTLVGRRGAESRWRVRVAIRAEPGPIELRLRVRFPDGRSVNLRQAMTVLPAASTGSSSRPALAVGIGIGILGLLTAGAVFVLLLRGRFK